MMFASLGIDCSMYQYLGSDKYVDISVRFNSSLVLFWITFRARVLLFHYFITSTRSSLLTRVGEKNQTVLDRAFKRLAFRRRLSSFLLKSWIRLLNEFSQAYSFIIYNERSVNYFMKQRFYIFRTNFNPPNKNMLIQQKHSQTLVVDIL